VAGRMARVGVVWHLRDRLADDYMNESTARLIRTLAPRFADGIIANSEATLATLGQILLPTAVIPSPLDPSILPTASGRRVRRIGMIGRISPWKGQVFFLEAFARAFGEGDEIAVLVGAPLFGEEDYDDEVTAAITSLGLMGRVERRGFRDDVNAELQRLDVVVHASTVPEPFGQVVVEAMAAGRPVVAANAGGPAETITDGIDGVLYELGDVGALAKAMIRVAGDDELRSRVVANGLVTAERYRPSVLSRDVVDLYRKILGVHD